MVEMWRQGRAVWRCLLASCAAPRARRTGVLWLALLLAAPGALAAAQPVASWSSLLFVVSKESQVYRQVVTAGQSALPATIGSAVVAADRSDPAALAVTIAQAQPELIVTVGTAAAELVYQTLYTDRAASSPNPTPKPTPNPKVLSTLLTRSGYRVFCDRYFVGLPADSAANLSVQFLDQPLERQLALAALIAPAAKRIGVMVGPANSLDAAQLAALDEPLAASLAPVFLTAHDNPIRLLEPAVAASDVFVPLADSRQLNLATSRWILQLSYRYRKPVIGYSASYVDAGAVAAVYTGVGDVAAQLSATLADWVVGGLPATGSERNPDGFSIKLNRTAALALGIELEDEAHYRNVLTERDQGAQYDLGR